MLLPKLLELPLVCLCYALVPDYDVISIIPYRCAVGVIKAARVNDFVINHAELVVHRALALNPTPMGPYQAFGYVLLGKAVYGKMDRFPGFIIKLDYWLVRVLIRQEVDAEDFGRKTPSRSNTQEDKG